MDNITNLLAKEKTTKQNRVWVRISAACNNLCVFCLDSDAQDGRLIAQDIVEKEIREWFKPWYENRVIISGGEASINPKFPHYIAYAKELWYDRVQTVTNGNMFASEKFCKKVFDAWLQEVTFSFHGHTSSLHDYLVSTPGAFKKSLRGLIYIKKYYPEVIINIDIVVNKVNVDFLPDIVKFFMKLWVYEYDILQIIPFWRGFKEHKNTLFYTISEHKDALTETWKLSRVPGMYMWTNRFHVEAFEWFEDLIQDPRKIKSEVLGESKEMFAPFIQSSGVEKPECFGERCEYCFLEQYCHGFLNHLSTPKLEKTSQNYVLQWEYFPSDVFKKYGKSAEEFKASLEKLQKKYKKIINLPKCLWWSGEYTSYNDSLKTQTLEEYTDVYIRDLYRKKSLRCWECIHSKSCEWIHLNFIRSYGFQILEPIQKKIRQ